MRKIDALEAYIFHKESISPKDLMNEFALSESTVRRYLATLMKKGSIVKEYGMVSAKKEDQLLKFSIRMNIESEKKREIAQLALDRIRDHETIFLDSGTTHMPLIELLKEREGLIIVTNNVMFSLQSVELQKRHKIILIPGSVNEHTLSITGESALMFLSDYHFDKGFFTASGVSLERGYTNRTLPERDIKAFVRKRSDHAFLLADDTKFHKEFPFSFGKLADMEEILTNKPLKKKEHQSFEKEGAVLSYPTKE